MDAWCGYKTPRKREASIQLPGVPRATREKRCFKPPLSQEVPPPSISQGGKRWNGHTDKNKAASPFCPQAFEPLPKSEALVPKAHDTVKLISHNQGRWGLFFRLWVPFFFSIHHHHWFGILGFFARFTSRTHRATTEDGIEQSGYWYRADGHGETFFHRRSGRGKKRTCKSLITQRRHRSPFSSRLSKKNSR